MRSLYDLPKIYSISINEEHMPALTPNQEGVFLDDLFGPDLINKSKDKNHNGKRVCFQANFAVNINKYRENKCNDRDAIEFNHLAKSDECKTLAHRPFIK